MAEILTAYLHLAGTPIFASHAPTVVKPCLPRGRGFVVPRRLVTAGSGRIALRCLVGIQRLLELPPFCLWKDLDEHDHDDPGPQCITEDRKSTRLNSSHT